MEIVNDDETENQGPTQSETHHIQATETISHSKRAKFLVLKDVFPGIWKKNDSLHPL